MITPRQDAWPISEVARMAGVSSRTLRHYEERGLISPAFTGTNGYRFYGMDELLRLQRILLLRRLGLGLEEIARILAGQTDEMEALAVHQRWLQEESLRLTHMAEAVQATLEMLMQGGTMDAQELFRGFSENPYEEEARQRWGDAPVDASQARLTSLGTDRQRELLQEAQAINTELAACLRAHLAPSDTRVSAAVARHYRWVCAGWTPDRDAYKALGSMYVQDGRFTAFYDREAPGLAAYLSTAIDAWADANL